jgi:hypothetical protein
MKQGQRLNLKFSVADNDRIISMHKAGYAVPDIRVDFAGASEIEVDRIIREFGLVPRYRRASA